MTKTHAIFLSRITKNFFGLSAKFKIEQFVITCEAANNSKLKTQNSKLFHRTRITRITRINTWWNFWLIHDNSWPKHHSASMKFFLSRITTNFFGLSVKFKIEQFVIACEAANNSKLKIQNSKLFHRTRITRIKRISR